MRKVPAGKLTIINDIRVALAKKHKATISCPTTTGIFAWVSVQPAEEQEQIGAKGITPYWRTLKTGGFLNEKYPGGAETQKPHLEREGQTVIKKAKNMVQNYGKSLIQI